MKAGLLLAGALLLGACTQPYDDFPAPPRTPVPQVQTFPTPTAIGGRPPVNPTPVSGAVPPDRDDPTLMVQSFFGLLERGDRDTALTFWRDPKATAVDVERVNSMFPTGGMESYDIGQVIPNGAAGTIFFAVPVAMTTRPVTGPEQRYAVCLTLSRSNVPTGTTNPPYPIVVRTARVNTTTADGDTVMMLATAMARSGDCQS